jgi:hypothetical protein
MQKEREVKTLKSRPNFEEASRSKAEEEESGNPHIRLCSFLLSFLFSSA